MFSAVAPEKKSRVSRLDLRRHGPEAPPRSFGPSRP
jgi:hypothetical protein